MKRMLASLLGTAIALGSGLALAAEADLQALEQAARKEGQVNSVGMPDSWANWKDTWKDLESKYGLKHMDTDMSSAQELAKFKAEKDNASADIGDVGAAFGPIAVQQGVSQPYKPSTWEQIPAWAKDQDGHWALAYTGTIAFIVNKQLVKDVPHSWADLLQGKYKVTIGDVSAAAQAVNGVLAAAIANGGDEEHQAGPGVLRQDRQAGPPVADQPGDRHPGKGRGRSRHRLGLQRPQLPPADRPGALRGADPRTAR